MLMISKGDVIGQAWHAATTNVEGSIHSHEGRKGENHERNGYQQGLFERMFLPKWSRNKKKIAQ